MSSCTNCEDGKYQSHERQAQCDHCQAGTEGSGDGQTQIGSCTSCVRGRFSSAPATAACLECPPGQYQTESDSLSCILCPAGMHANVSGTEGVDRELDVLNLTAGKLAIQSSTAGGNTAALAIDGNTSGTTLDSCSRTGGGTAGWWQLDLGVRHTVTTVHLHHYTDGPVGAAASITNGNFDNYTGSESAGYFSVPEGSTDITGWTIEGSVVSIEFGSSAWGGVSSVAGTHFTCLHGTNGGTISTTVGDLQVGFSYTLSWYERDRPGYAPKSLTVTAGNTQETYDTIELSALHTVSDEWTQVSAAFTTTASSMVFRFHDPGSSEDGSVFLDAINLQKFSDGMAGARVIVSESSDYSTGVEFFRLDWEPRRGGCQTLVLGSGSNIYCEVAASLSLPPCDSFSDFEGEVAAVRKVCEARPECAGVIDVDDNQGSLRLCSTNSIQLDETSNHTVWPATRATWPCNALRCGSPGGCSETEYCADLTEKHEVGCCADSEVDNFAQVSGCSVWSARDPGDSECQHGLNFNDAQTFCESVGGRLCTAAELDAGCTRGTGCQHDFDLQWSRASGVPPSFTHTHTLTHSLTHSHRLFGSGSIPLC